MIFVLFVLAFGLMYFTLLAAFILKELKAITVAIGENTKAISTNAPMVANAEATDRLASRLQDYIEHEWHAQH